MSSEFPLDLTELVNILLDLKAAEEHREADGKSLAGLDLGVVQEVA